MPSYIWVSKELSLVLFLAIFVLSACITRCVIASVTALQKKIKPNKNNNWNYYAPTPPPSSAAICFIYVFTNTSGVIWVFWKRLAIAKHCFPLKQSLPKLLYFISVLPYCSDFTYLHCRFFIINRFFNCKSLCSLNLVGLYPFLLVMSDLCGQLLLMLMESKCINLSTVDR